jgi:hypothetical protein
VFLAFFRAAFTGRRPSFLLALWQLPIQSAVTSEAIIWVKRILKPDARHTLKHYFQNSELYCTGSSSNRKSKGCSGNVLRFPIAILAISNAFTF